MEALNTAGPIRIKRLFDENPKTKRKVLRKDQFQLVPEPSNNLNLSSLPAYTTGGIATQVKIPRRVSFQTLSQQILTPTMLPAMNTAKAFTDFNNQLHFARLAIWEFQEKNGALPKLHDESDAKKCVGIAEDVNE